MLFPSPARWPKVGGELAASCRRAREEIYEKRQQLVGRRVRQLTVAQFYAGRSVFVTGGSGFLGRLIVEQLLRTCPDIGSIYLLLRAKKGAAPQDRLGSLLDVPLFDRLRAERPDALSKLVVLPGDTTELGLGLSAEHQQLLEQHVSVVFHVAASVRFDDPFRKAVLTNLRSTREVVALARRMRGLRALVHVSTAYTNINREPVRERVYRPSLDWRQVIRMAEEMDDASLWAVNCLGHKLRDFHANMYTFTKALAEQLIDDVRTELPVVIVRPSVVVPTFKDPIPGWIDNLYGLGGFWTGGWKGLIRVGHGEDFTMDSVPADMVTKTTVLASWARGQNLRIRPHDEDEGLKGVEVVHSTIGVLGCTYKDMEWGLTDYGLFDQLVYPGAIRYPKYTCVSSRALYTVMHWYHHLLYGAVLDVAARLAGQKPRAIKLYRKLEVSYDMVKAYNREFKFEAWNQRLLQILMHPADEEAYCIMEVFTARDNMDNFRKWSYEIMRGVLVYVLKEEDNPKKHRKHIERLKWAMNVYHGTMASLAGLAVYYLAT